MDKMNLENIVGNLLAWYQEHARILPWREAPTAYFVWVSEIMLQQTRVEAVKAYFKRFIEALPTIDALAEAQEDVLLKLWEGLGYYNRVKNMQKAARIVMQQHNGTLPASYEELLLLPGIGEYTAGAIASIAYGLPVPAVDGNVLRVITRLTANGGDITNASVKREITRQVQEILPVPFAGAFNQALMELGALICIPNGVPLCKECPIIKCCAAYRQSNIQLFPNKPPKKDRKCENRVVFLLFRGNKVALRKREGKGLLAGLWEFPQEEGCYSETFVSEMLKKWGVYPFHFSKLDTAKHIFTHKEWHMQGCFVAIEHEGKEEFIWATAQELKQVYAVPSAFRVYQKEVLKRLE